MAQGPFPAGDLLPRHWPDGADDPDPPQVVIGTPVEHAYQHAVARHRHERTQLLYAIDGVMLVTTDGGVWMIPPRRALLIAPGVTHEVTMLSKVSLRSLYIAPGAVTGFDQVRGKPRPSGRGQERGRHSRPVWRIE